MGTTATWVEVDEGLDIAKVVQRSLTRYFNCCSSTIRVLNAAGGLLGGRVMLLLRAGIADFNRDNDVLILPRTRLLLLHQLLLLR